MLTRTGPCNDTGARLDVNHVVIETVTLTRTFGMVPASRADIIEPAMLERVVVAANTFIKAGASLDPALLEGTTLVAVKRFYAAAREVSWVDPALQLTRLRERAWRCASYIAFYSLQEHQRRCKIVPAVVKCMHGMSSVQLREQPFPSKEFLDEARDTLKDAGLPAGCLSTVYLSSMARHARRLLEASMRTTCRAAITRSIMDITCDLNGSRNVRLAPTSPRLNAKGEGARYRPLACHVSTSPNLDKPGKMSNFVQV